MTSVPYPSFVHQRPVDAAANRAALSAVGRCRVYPESCTFRGAIPGKDGLLLVDEDVDDEGADEYLAIVAKNVLQAQVDTMSSAELEEASVAALSPTSAASASSSSSSTSQKVLLSKEQLKKRHMKEGVAMARCYLHDTLQLDTSIVDVEMVVRAEDLMDTQGCLASCLLDAGCAAIVTDGQHVDALDVCQVPRERLIAHFVYNNNSITKHPNSSSGSGNHATEPTATTASAAKFDDLIPAIQAASKFASSVSIELNNMKHISTDTISPILQFATHQDDTQHEKVQVILQLHPHQDVGTATATTSNDNKDDHNNGSDVQLAKWVGSTCRKLKNGAGTVSLIDPSTRQLGLCYAACCTTDRKDQLYTTVVCTRNGEALGLVYSSVESIIAALESGRGVYYSRSRKGLWRKGDTSGHYQTLHRIDVDCDGDALRFTVTQRGGRGVGDDAAAAAAAAAGTTSTQGPAFCHLNTLTCWGPPHGLRHLEETLQQRLQDAPAGSYTKRLFDDSTLLRNKLVEEAQELSEATDPHDVASELADVLYFCMVRAAKAGVSLDDAVQELDLRARKVTRRQGDSKQFRIDAGNAILLSSQQNQQQQQQQEANQPQPKQE